MITILCCNSGSICFNYIIAAYKQTKFDTNTGDMNVFTHLMTHKDTHTNMILNIKKLTFW
jgi:hypothetical protein